MATTPQFGWGRLNSHKAVTNGATPPGEGGDPPPGLTASFTVSCTGTDCHFNGGSSTGATTWDWSGAFSTSGVTTSFDFGGAGNFDVTLTVTDGGTGSDAVTQTVNCKRRGRNGTQCN